MRPAEKEEAEMRKSKFSESQIVAILKEGEAGLPPKQFLPRLTTAADSSNRLST